MINLKSLDVCKRLPILTAILILINVLAVITQELTIMRLVRLISIVIFLIYYWVVSLEKSTIILLILGTLVARDIAVQFYETQLGHSLYLVLGCISYGFICLERSDVVKMILQDKSAILYTIIFIVLNTMALYYITSLIADGFKGPFEPYLFYIYGVFMILLGTTAVMYNQIYNSNRSLVYMFFMICFLTSDISSLFAYYFGYDLFFYVDKFLFILGLGFFTYTVLETRTQEEEAEQFRLLS